MPKKTDLPQYQQTVRMLNMELHYRDVGLMASGSVGFKVAPAYTTSRFNRLCQLQNATPWEIGHFICLDKSKLRRYHTHDCWPGEVALVLDRHERFLIHQLTGIEQPSPHFPFSLTSVESNQCRACGGPLVVKEAA